MRPSVLLLAAFLAAFSQVEGQSGADGQAEAIERLNRISKAKQKIDESRKVPQQPSKFVVPEWAGHGNPAKVAYTTMARPSPNYKIYYNIWWHNARWYALLPPEDMERSSTEDGLSTNMGVVRTPVEDLQAFAGNVRYSVVQGNSILLDFPFQTFYDSLGHWGELMVPAYSVLSEGEWAKHTSNGSSILTSAMLPNLNRHMNHWFLRMYKLGLAPAKPDGRDAPTMLDFIHLERYDKLAWLLFENLLVVQDRYTHPQRKIGFAGTDHGDLWRYDGCDRYVARDYAVRFFSPEHGRQLRASAYINVGLPEPTPWAQDGSPPPPLGGHITLLQHAGNRTGAITNAPDLMAMLHEVAAQFGLRAREVVLTNDASFDSHLVVFAQSAVVVSRHTDLLASSIFMRPGGMVFELLPFKWEWHNMSKLYYNQTQSIGDIHHFAWRPYDVKFCGYREKQHMRYKDWLPEECHARECLMPHFIADLRVDVRAVRAKLVSKLEGMVAGKTVAELAEPWPPASK